MTVHFDYPGIYTREFTPGPPIEGVGTSTAAFVGTAEKGPVGRPTRISDWDAFQSRFGGISADRPAATLAPALFGFFRNGGTDCFVVRAATALHAQIDLQGSAGAVLAIEAVDEGLAGNAIEVTVQHSSLLESMLPAGQSPLRLHLEEVSLGGDPLLPDPVLGPRRLIRVPNNMAFEVGERVTIERANAVSQSAIVQARRDADKLVLSAKLPGSATFATNATLKSGDLLPGDRRLRVEVPAGVRIDRALPRGATVRLSSGPNTETRIVDTTRAAPGGAVIALTSGLSDTHTLKPNRPTVTSLEFDLIIPGADPGVFRFLSMNADHPNYWGRAVTSPLVILREPDPPPAQAADDPRPSTQAPPVPQPLQGGEEDDRAKAWADLLADNDPPQLRALEAIGEVDIVCMPGATTKAAQDGLIAHCRELLDRFAILDPELGADATAIGAQVERVRADDGFAALYWPSILVRNPKTGRTEAVAPSGHIAGVYARTDATGGVHTAPANTGITGAIGLERRIGDREQGPLNEQGINVLRIFPGQAQPIVWGARTTYTDNVYWRYVNIRRLFLFLENSIERSIRWAVFQPNNLSLWEDLRRVIGEFLTKVWRDGALFGATADEAFYVRIDRALNPTSEQELGRLHIEIGLRPAYPAEFIVVRIGISRAGTDVTEL